MPFRSRFDCLWCGDPWTARGPADLEGWALLCPTCLGKAGTNRFLRDRLRAALTSRAAEGGTPGGSVAGMPAPATADGGSTVVPRPARNAPASAAHPAFPDDWFLRRGPYQHGPVHDTAWTAELDAVTRWLDDRPLAGRILEPGAGVGFFSPLLAEHGELHATDPDGTALDRARDRLLAHRLPAHLHVADPWTFDPGAPPADALVAAFLLGRVRGAGLDSAAASFRARLRRGAALAVVELRPDSAGGPPPGTAWTWHDPYAVEAAMARAGFGALELRETGRFFLLVSATAV
jgi:hypothetical protein